PNKSRLLLQSKPSSRASHQRCRVPTDELDAREREWNRLAAHGGSYDAHLRAALVEATGALEVASAAAHAGDEDLAEELLRKALALDVSRGKGGALLRTSPSPGATAAGAVAAPPRAELLRLQLKAARCLGDMPAAAALHAALAEALGAERPKHVEVLAHWLAHLRAGGLESTRAFREVRTLATFWFGESMGLAALCDWSETCGLGPRRL
ncbi:unnamed protein product, partial [Polarella glacialis]